MGKKRIPSIESDEQLSKMSSKQSIPVIIPISIYEDFCLTHPNVAESIFDKLNNKSLIKCRRVSKVLNTFLPDFDPIILMRKIKKTLGNQNQFAKLWKPILKSLSADNLKQLEIAMNLFYSGKDICRYGQNTQICQLQGRRGLETPIALEDFFFKFFFHEITSLCL